MIDKNNVHTYINEFARIQPLPFPKILSSGVIVVLLIPNRKCIMLQYLLKPYITNVETMCIDDDESTIECAQRELQSLKISTRDTIIHEFGHAIYRNIHLENSYICYMDIFYVKLTQSKENDWTKNFIGSEIFSCDIVDVNDLSNVNISPHHKLIVEYIIHKNNGNF